MTHAEKIIAEEIARREQHDQWAIDRYNAFINLRPQEAVSQARYFELGEGPPWHLLYVEGLFNKGLDYVSGVVIKFVHHRENITRFHRPDNADMRAIMRVRYERDIDERVEEWDEFHAMMFKLRYGFNLYPESYNVSR